VGTTAARAGAQLEVMNAPGVVCEAQAREVWGEKGELAEQRGRVALGALRADSRWDGRRRCPYPRPLLGSSDERGPPARNLPTTRERRNSLPLRSARPESTHLHHLRGPNLSRVERRSDLRSEPQGSERLSHKRSPPASTLPTYS
jgi:hypothetical protein